MNNTPTHPSAPEISRRQFVAHAGAGLATLCTTSLAVAQGSAANSRVRLGLIGCGQRGLWLAGHFIAHGGYEIAAVADYFPARTEAAVTKYKLDPSRTFHGLGCAEKMIAQGGLDAVAIISPPYFHPEQARAAVAAGLHVYLAKPVAVDVPGCRVIRSLGEKARAAKRVFLVDFQTRANGFYREAISRVHKGALGKLCFGESTYHADRLAIKTPPGSQEARLRNWVFDKALSGDIIVEQNIHTIDVMSWIMQDKPATRCQGTGGRLVRTDVGDAWDHFALLFEYPEHVGVTFSSRQYNAFGTPGGINNRMFGSEGVLLATYGGDVMIRGDASYYRGGKTNQIYQEGAVANITRFHKNILDGDATNETVEPSVTSNLIAIMGRTAAYENRTVTWAEMMASTAALKPDLSGLQS